MREITCAVCGAPAVASNGRQIYCLPCAAEKSRQHANRKRPARYGSRPGPNCRINWAQCDECTRWFVKRNGATYCSTACRLSVKRRESVEYRRSDRYRSRQRTSCPIAYADCRRCGRCFIKRAPNQSFCSAACNRSALRRRQKHTRRTVERAGENFTLREIAERDAWRCHICGRDVPDREYGARPLDPTLDHLIPVSAGGGHTRDNVALAHNRCNWQRGAAGLAQLRLVG